MLVPHESLDQTVFRLAAAEVLDLAVPPVPDASQVAVMLKGLPGQDRVVRTVLWSLLVRDDAAVSLQLRDVRQVCEGHQVEDLDPRDCPALLGQLKEVAVAAGRGHLLDPLAGWVGRVSPCRQERVADLESALGAVGCRTPLSRRQVDALVGPLKVGNLGLTDPVALWRAAALSRRTGHARPEAVALVDKALAQPRREGLYLSAAEPVGTAMSTWALLTAASAGRPLHDDRLVAALRRSDINGRADVALFRDAALLLLGERSGGQVPTDSMKLADSDGPYYPFVALAARQLGVQDKVAFVVPRASYEADPIALASAVTTSFLLDRQRLQVTRDQIAGLVKVARETRLPHGARLLARTALEILGEDTSALDEQVWDWGGCDGLEWMLNASSMDPECDLRATVSWRLRETVRLMLA